MSCISVLTTYCQRCFTQAHTTKILKTRSYLIQSIVKEPIQSSRHMKPIQTKRNETKRTETKRSFPSVHRTELNWKVCPYNCNGFVFQLWWLTKRLLHCNLKVRKETEQGWSWHHLYCLHVHSFIDTVFKTHALFYNKKRKTIHTVAQFTPSQESQWLPVHLGIQLW